MPYWQTYYHLVWATEGRAQLIQPAIEPRLYAYIVRKAAENGVCVYAINGWYDHVHLVAAIPPSVAVANLVMRMKGASAHDLNHPPHLEGPFAWQRGYGVLTLGRQKLPEAIGYVSRQKEHHREGTPLAILERYSEESEGPRDRGLRPEGVPEALGMVREEAVPYEIAGLGLAWIPDGLEEEDDSPF